MVLVFCVSMALIFSLTSAAVVNKKAEEDGTTCSSYGYCQGESFPGRFMIKDRAINCREGVTNQTLRDSCCLPQEYHFVCYDISVEGDLLNYSEDSNAVLSSTDFTGLCAMMVEAVGRTPGKYSAASIVPDGGEKAFVYGSWAEVDASDSHIGNVACGVRAEQ